MPMGLAFIVPGDPRGKGRPRFSKGRTYTDDKTVEYERRIRNSYRLNFGSYKWPDNALLKVQITAYYSIPKSATKAKRAMMESGDLLPTRKPDVDNIIKAVLDALNGVAYKDDASVVEVSCRKLYGTPPRVEVEIMGEVLV